MRRLKTAVMTIGLLAAAPAAADDQVFSCWEGSFAYTLAGIREISTGFQVRVTTQDETLLSAMVPGRELGWGQAVLDVTFDEEACAVDWEAGLFTCEASPISASFFYGLVAGREPVGTPLLLDQIRVELVRIVRAGDDETTKPNRELLIQLWRRPDPVTIRMGFGEHSSCDGWPDPFAIR